MEVTHTHTVGNLQSVLDVTTKRTDTSKTALVWDNKIFYLLTLNLHLLVTSACT